MVTQRKLNRNETPRPSANAYKPNRDGGEIPDKVKEFKATYVLERRILEGIRGKLVPYVPSPSLDGEKAATIEDKDKPNVWVKMYIKLERMSSAGLQPSAYLRVLFSALRGTSVAIPWLPQVASNDMLEIVYDYVADIDVIIKNQLMMDGARAKSSIRIGTLGYKQTMAHAVCLAVLDRTLGLSPLFCYCLLYSTAAALREGGDRSIDRDRLERLIGVFSIQASLEYSLFPEKYDKIWANEIPADFSYTSRRVLRKQLDRCSNSNV